MEIPKQKQRRKRKCLCCNESYVPDARNRWHQRYCSKPECRKASKQASQGRWLSSDKGRGYFLGPVHVERVKMWREAHSGYWKGSVPRVAEPLQDVLSVQVAVDKCDTTKLNVNALQDVMTSQPALLIGLIATLTGCALQDDIAKASRRYITLGHDILGFSPKNKSEGGVP